MNLSINDIFSIDIIVGAHLIHEVNYQKKTTLHSLVSYNRGGMNLNLIKTMIRYGGDELVLVQNFMQYSVLHRISMYALAEGEPNKELALYLRTGSIFSFERRKKVT